MRQGVETIERAMISSEPSTLLDGRFPGIKRHLSISSTLEQLGFEELTRGFAQ